MSDSDQPLLVTQRIVQLCLFLVAAIALTGGTLQMYWGQPETTPRLDNVHRFLAGIYLGSGFIALWAALTVRRQTTLIYLIALAAFLGGCGRLLSMRLVGLPEPSGVWLGYLVPELTLPCIMVLTHLISRWQLRGTAGAPPPAKH